MRNLENRLRRLERLSKSRKRALPFVVYQLEGESMEEALARVYGNDKSTHLTAYVLAPVTCTESSWEARYSP